MKEKHRKDNHIFVACGIIEKDGLVLAAQRNRSMHLPLKWEFPGGKIENGESPEECLVREVMEELAIEIRVVEALSPATHTYPRFTVTLYPFVCSIISGEIVANEHAALAWMEPEKLHLLDWAEADWPIIAEYQRRFETDR
jgi:8-oxo-dGTP diphosphatase